MSTKPQRIIARVDELLRWCDELERNLAVATIAGTHLLDALLQKVLNAAP